VTVLVKMKVNYKTISKWKSKKRI